MPTDCPRSARRHAPRRNHGQRSASPLQRSASQTGSVFSQQILQPAVLVLERPQPRRLRHGHPAVFRLPVVERRIINPVLPAQLGGFHAGLILAQHANDLIPGKLASPHHSSPSDEQISQWHDFGEQIRPRRIFQETGTAATLSRGVEDAEVALDACVDLIHPAPDRDRREVTVARIHPAKAAPVHRDRAARDEAELPPQAAWIAAHVRVESRRWS